MAYQGYEEYDFWHVFGGMPDEIEPIDIEQYKGGKPVLYKVSSKTLKLTTIHRINDALCYILSGFMI